MVGSNKCGEYVWQRSSYTDNLPAQFGKRSVCPTKKNKTREKMPDNGVIFVWLTQTTRVGWFECCLVLLRRATRPVCSGHRRPCRDDFILRLEGIRSVEQLHLGPMVSSHARSPYALRELQAWVSNILLWSIVELNF